MVESQNPATDRAEDAMKTRKTTTLYGALMLLPPIWAPFSEGTVFDPAFRRASTQFSLVLCSTFFSYAIRFLVLKNFLIPDGVSEPDGVVSGSLEESAGGLCGVSGEAVGPFAAEFIDNQLNKKNT